MTNFWVFGYGSLMWNPGFEHAGGQPALLRGAHRSLCIYSWVHRGTQQKPGLVFGLDQGGACRGMAWYVHAKNSENVIAYLRKREQATMVYREVWRSITLANGEKVQALTYVADRSHEQYAGVLSRQQQLDIVCGAYGQSGPNPEYIINTASHMAELGIKDGPLFWLAEKLKAHPAS